MLSREFTFQQLEQTPIRTRSEGELKASRIASLFSLAKTLEWSSKPRAGIYGELHPKKIGERVKPFGN